jgi:hypothetical protein
VLKLFDKEMPVCVYDRDGDKANTLSVLHVENACSYDNNYKFVQADSLVLAPNMD